MDGLSSRWVVLSIWPCILLLGRRNHESLKPPELVHVGRGFWVSEHASGLGCLELFVWSFPYFSYLWTWCPSNMIQNMIKDGKIVPSEVTVKLLLKAMNEATTDKFLIDGFPRNEENRLAFEKVVRWSVYLILFTAMNAVILLVFLEQFFGNQARISNNRMF